MSSTVTIGSKQWLVSVASTPAELLTGLSGIAAIETGTGMLFDMGSPQSSIEINTSQMLFNIDVVFISENGLVLGRCLGVEPSEECKFEASSTSGARWFLEVNAGEANDVEVGDSASIQGGVVMNNQVDLNTLMSYMIMMMVLVMMMRMMTKALKPAEVKMLGYGEVPAGYKPLHHSPIRRLGRPRSEEERARVHKEFYGKEKLPPRGTGLSERGETHSIHGPEREELVDLYGTWSVGRAESVCPEGDVECVRRESARLAAIVRRGV